MTRRVSHWLYRRLLRLYPLEFRAHFHADLLADFDDLVAHHGLARAWLRVIRDLRRSLLSIHRHTRVRRARVRALGPRGDSPMSSLLFDLRHAWRGLRKSPVFAAVTIVTLALGIGANSAIFSLVNAVLLRPIGYHQPERLMMIHESVPQSRVARFGVSPADYLDMIRYQSAFTAMGAYRTRTFEFSGSGEPEQITTAQVTPEVFPILGVAPAIGRTFDPSGAAADDRTAVLSHGFWQRRYGGRDVVGERVVLDRQPYTIIGVMPAAFQFPKRGAQFNGEPADVWLPLVFNPFERQARAMFFNHSVVGRVKDGLTLAQAAADTAALAPKILEGYPAQLRGRFDVEVAATAFVDEIAGPVQRPLLILLGAVGLVLLVACANVANLALSRAVTREREVGVRAALGAARYRLLQMSLIESGVLALAGGALGLALGHAVVRAMPAVLSTSLPGVADVALDWRVVGFTAALSLVTALVCGTAPILAGTRRDLNDLLREGAARATGGLRQHRVQASLVVSSIAFAFVLLIGAGLLIRSFSSLMAVETGVRADNVLSLQVALPPASYPNAAAIRPFYRNLSDQLRALPGVRAASIASDLPLREDGERRAFTPERSDNAGGVPPSVAVTWIHGDYFGTFGIPIVRGRAFTSDEEDANREVAIVSHALANRFWPGQDPVGKRLRWGIATSQAPWKTIVGVAGDVVDGAMGADPIIHVYVPYSEFPDAAMSSPLAGLTRRMTIAVHTQMDAASALGSVRGVLRAIDPALAVSDVATLDQVVAEATAPQRFSASVLAAFAAGALLLAGIGLYGVLAFGVANRTREIGVRLALGARRAEVIALVVRQGMLLVAFGLAIGLAGAFAATRLMRTLLFEVQATDPWTFATVPLLLTVIALIACYLPARRAARVEPVEALRT